MEMMPSCGQRSWKNVKTCIYWTKAELDRKIDLNLVSIINFVCCQGSAWSCTPGKTFWIEKMAEVAKDFCGHYVLKGNLRQSCNKILFCVFKVVIYHKSVSLLSGFNLIKNCLHDVLSKTLNLST